MSSMRRHWKRWLIAGVAVAALLVVGGPYVYIHYIKDTAPSELSIDDGQQSAGQDGTSARAGVEGAWKVGSGSQAGYRVDEVLFGQNTTAVGRTDKVTGDLTVKGTEATEGSFTVDLTSVKSDSVERDGQFRGGIMNTEKFPTATFELTRPVDFGSVPDVGKKVTAKASGRFTIHGVSKNVSFDLTAQRSAGAFRVQGSLPITFADYGVESPNFGGITVEHEGTIEFLLTFLPA
ncbi:YceI family protein [Streptomyces sp. NPDC005811]|uniref:YceI family protein n=1 Tax=Streptomyces sp. NPDC005811 TaxID=3154565 RepID=UPI00340F8220